MWQFLWAKNHHAHTRYVPVKGSLIFIPELSVPGGSRVLRVGKAFEDILLAQ
jgi:hypothetical protein